MEGKKKEIVIWSGGETTVPTMEDVHDEVDKIMMAKKVDRQTRAPTSSAEFSRQDYYQADGGWQILLPAIHRVLDCRHSLIYDSSEHHEVHESG